MAESKTARASMMAGANKPAKADPFDTPEKKINELRKLRVNHLFVNRMDFVDALLEAYDTAASNLDLAQRAAVNLAEKAARLEDAESRRRFPDTTGGQHE